MTHREGNGCGTHARHTWFWDRFRGAAPYTWMCIITGRTANRGCKLVIIPATLPRGPCRHLPTPRNPSPGALPFKQLHAPPRLTS